jgi:class 3 adenylate cyclase/TolB-like protein/tetratricopeptide (TPR) repeat protein
VQEGVVSRKLTSIVSVDVAGYSALTEADEQAAVAAVAALAQRIAVCAQAHGGRVFSSAGDGFMLEFSTTSPALQAALAIAADVALPVRVSVHVGEVSVLESGDLLGHGVNIAARLQHLAKPGGVVVSEEVRRAVRGPLVSRMVPIGSVKLDKMSETIAAYRIEEAATMRARIAAAVQPLQRLPRWSLGAAIFGVIVLAAGVLWFANRAPNVRTTVFTFDATAADTELSALAQNVAAEVVGTMNEIGLDAISRAETGEADADARLRRARSLGAAFALDGHIAREAGVVRVSVRLDDVRAGQTIWSETFERPSAEAGGLRLEVPARTVSVMRCAAQARRELPDLDHALMTLLLRSCAIENDYVRQVETLELTRQFAQALPRSSLAQGRLAIAAAPVVLNEAPPAMREQLQREALDAADVALRFDPHNGTAAAARLWMLLPDQDHANRERAILSALRAAPEHPELHTLYSRFLREVGRNEEAIAYARRALAGDPLSTYRVYSLVWSLAITGRSREARELLARYAERWPEEGDIWEARFRLSLWVGAPGEAQQLLEEEPPSTFTHDDLTCWRGAAAGLATENVAARRRAAAAVRACPNPDLNLTIQFLGGLGDIDGAFETADALLARDGERAWWGMFFEPSSHAVRRDRRFMPFMQRAGLIDYWRTSDRWPDFCAEPDLPYDCRAEAARLAGVNR